MRNEVCEVDRPHLVRDTFKKSAWVHDRAGVDDSLRRYHLGPLRAPPLQAFPKPDPQLLHWHATEVFKEPGTIP